MQKIRHAGADYRSVVRDMSMFWEFIGLIGSCMLFSEALLRGKWIRRMGFLVYMVLCVGFGFLNGEFWLQGGYQSVFG
jgi:hypothetical protein